MNKMKKKLELIIVFFILLSGCKNTFILPANVEQVLILSGENRKELESVINRYSKSKKDSLKLQAAYYLISNMPGHLGKYSDSEYSNSLHTAIYQGIREELYIKTTHDPKWNEIENSISANIIIKPDIETIEAKYLINNIEEAFSAWESLPWGRTVDFETFKMTILPYRVKNEALTDYRALVLEKYKWLQDSLKGCTDPAVAFEVVYNDFYKEDSVPGNWQYGPIESIEDLIHSFGGKCSDACIVLSNIMHALCIPSTLDYTPHWANRALGHDWVAYYNPDTLPMIIDLELELKYPDFLPSAIFEGVYPGDSLLPDEIYLTPYKKGAKIYRQVYEIDSENLMLYNEAQKLSANIIDIHSTDISAQYLNTQDFIITADNVNPFDMMALAIFDINNLSPVCWARLENGKYLFKDVGADVLYFPVGLRDGKLYNTDKPFIIQPNGKIEYYPASEMKKQDMIIYRKYPLFENILNYGNLLYNCKIQGANMEDFSDAIGLYFIDSTYLTPEEVTVRITQSFRFYRFLSAEGSTGDIAEIEFMYKDNTGSDSKIMGNPVYKHAGNIARSYRNAFDGKIETFYKSDTASTWIGIDAGINQNEKVSKIRFCPRTDTNFIIPGNKYELFIWEDGWKSLGTKMAVSYKLIFSDVPCDGIYWLHCHSGGKEERPFTYQDGKQIWW